MKPYTIGDSKALSQITIDNPLMAGIPESVLRLTQSIIAVGGGTPDSPQELISWFNALPPGDSEQLVSFFDEMQPSLDMQVIVGCNNESCGKDFDYTLSMDTDFFRRGVNIRPGAKVAAAS